MKKPIFLLFLFFLLSYSIIAAPVVINGKSSAGSNYIFRVYQQKDPVSGETILVNQVRPDSKGLFSLNIDIKDIQQITIMVGLQSLKLYVQPEKTYNLSFNKITLKDQNIFLPQKPLDVVFEDEDMLNLAIDGFDYEYQKFLSTKFLELVKYKDKVIYTTFESYIYKLYNETKFSDIKAQEFFKQYIDYKMAELKLTSRLVSKEKIGLEMLMSQNISFNNPAYCQFFTKYFDKYIVEFDGGKAYDDIITLINNGLPITELFDKLGKDPVLVKEKLREIVLMNTLRQVFYSKEISQQNINSILTYLGKNSKFETNRIMAIDLLNSLNQFVRGNPVPDFIIKNSSEQPTTLAKYGGKNLYIMFLSNQCETCEADLKVLNTLKKEMPEIQFLAIVAGYSKTEATAWIKKQQVSWDMLWFNDDYGLLNEYRIKNFPSYLLIDQNGNLVNAFPPSPRENLKSYFQMVLNKQNGKENYEPTEFFQKN